MTSAYMSRMSISRVLSRFCEKMGVLKAAFSPLITVEMIEEMDIGYHNQVQVQLSEAHV